ARPRTIPISRALRTLLEFRRATFCKRRQIAMRRDPKSDQRIGIETTSSAGNASDRELAALSRREFLTNSTGLAVAGAIGGLAGNMSLSAQEPAPAGAARPHSSATPSAPTSGKP